VPSPLTSNDEGVAKSWPLRSDERTQGGNSSRSQAEVDASGVVLHMVTKGTSTEGVAIELPLVVLTLLDGDRITRVEAFDPAQRTGRWRGSRNSAASDI
jgi:hypothetical protein